MEAQARPQPDAGFLSGPILPPLIRFSLPLMLSLLLQALYGGVDLAVVGWFSTTAHVSAVATGSQMMQAVTVVITGLTMGVTVLLGHALGADDPKRAGGRNSRPSPAVFPLGPPVHPGDAPAGPLVYPAHAGAGCGGGCHRFLYPHLL